MDKAALRTEGVVAYVEPMQKSDLVAEHSKILILRRF